VSWHRPLGERAVNGSASGIAERRGGGEGAVRRARPGGATGPVRTDPSSRSLSAARAGQASGVCVSIATMPEPGWPVERCTTAKPPVGSAAASSR